MRARDIKPGWYRACLSGLPRNAIRVHLISNGFVLFTRRGLPHMSKIRIESFVGMVERIEKTKES